MTTQGEDVINAAWDVIAAKGFEKDMFFEHAAVDIRALPKLEGTVHVNIALIAKFMPAYFFMPTELPAVPRRDDAANDDFLFDQGPTRGLSKIRFHDYNLAYADWDVPNVKIFREQIAAFKQLLASARPTPDQQKHTDFLLAGGELFTLIVYGQLILENARIYGQSEDLVDQIFDLMIRDFSKLAIEMHGKAATTDAQAAQCLSMVRKPAADAARYGRVWDTVHSLEGAYEMAP